MCLTSRTSGKSSLLSSFVTLITSPFIDISYSASPITLGHLTSQLECPNQAPANKMPSDCLFLSISPAVPSPGYGLFLPYRTPSNSERCFLESPSQTSEPSSMTVSDTKFNGMGYAVAYFSPHLVHEVAHAPFTNRWFQGLYPFSFSRKKLFTYFTLNDNLLL